MQRFFQFILGTGTLISFFAQLVYFRQLTGSYFLPVLNQIRMMAAQVSTEGCLINPTSLRNRLSRLFSR